MHNYANQPPAPDAFKILHIYLCKQSSGSQARTANTLGNWKT